MLTNKDIKPVTIIGSGPGSLDMLTIRAWNILQQVDIVLYDDLVGEEILNNIPENIQKIYVGIRFNDCQNQKDRMEKIRMEFLRGKTEGKKIARLKGGDPMVFSRTAEEIFYLNENNIDFEIVPGITAGLAAANACGIPLTIRGKVRKLVCITLTTEKEEESQFLDVEKHLQLNASVIIYMGTHKLKDLLDYLIKKSMGELSVCIISNVSLPNEKIISGDIATILRDFETKKIEKPSITILGKHMENYI